MIDLQPDIKENDILALSPELLGILLKDHTLSTDTGQANIFWATDNYADRGEGYQYYDQITIEAITGKNGNVIVPRALKTREKQQQRSREMAEVFTPSWICNKQNNLIDNAWFGREEVFNTEVDNTDGSHSWIVNAEPIAFPDGKTWRDYVNENRLEITCGEAPYLVSRYDAVTGEPIPVERRGRGARRSARRFGYRYSCGSSRCFRQVFCRTKNRDFRPALRYRTGKQCKCIASGGA